LDYIGLDGALTMLV